MSQKHAGKSRSRGEKMNVPRDPVIVHGTQRNDNESADPPVRSNTQTWKANTLPTREAAINSPKSREASPSKNLRSSTPKTTTTGLNPVLLSRSSSTGSGTKNATTIIATNSTSHNLGLRRSPSDSLGMKDKVMNRSSRLQGHESSSSTKNKKKTRSSPTSTPSDVDSPTEDNDLDDTSDNDSNDTRTEKDLSSKKRKAKDSRKDSRKELEGQKKKRTSSSSVKSPKTSSAKRNQTRYLDSSSDESDEVDKPDEESPKPSTGSALKKSQYKNLDPNSKDAAIGKFCYNNCLFLLINLLSQLHETHRSNAQRPCQKSYQSITNTRFPNFSFEHIEQK
jgi:hypothetical protein